MHLDKETILSIEDCKQIIKNYLCSNKEFQIINYEVEPFSNSVNGFMGDYYLIRISFSANISLQEEVRFFSKRFPFNHKLHTEYALSVRAFTNEIFTYQNLFEEFKIFDGFNANFAPRFFLGKDNDLIVFEDLSEKDFVLPTPNNALSLDVIKLSLSVLAKYHAGSIGYQEIKSKQLGKRYRLIDEYPECMQEPLFRNDEKFLGYGWFKARLSALKGVIDLLEPSNMSKERFKETLNELAYKSFEILQPKDEFYNVLCHGDMWAKNVMIRYENDKPKECKIIDFQLQRYCPPAHDVLQFIYLTTSTSKRKCHLHELFRFYHNCLREELNKGGLNIDTIIPYEDFEKSINYLLPQIKLQTAYYYTFQGANQEFHKRLTSNAEEFKKFVFEDGAPFSVELFKTDENYKRLMIETLAELQDYITHSRITLEDCYKIIPGKIKTAKYELLNYSLDPLKKIGGFLGDHYKLKIDISKDNVKQKLHLFAKCAPEIKTRYEMAVESRALIKESFVLQKLFPIIQKYGIDIISDCIIPHYLIRQNDAIVFEDMEFKGYYAADPRIPLDYKQLQVVVKKLAIYHACNIIVEEKISQELSRKFRLIESFKDELNESFFVTKNRTPSSLSIDLGVETVNHQIDMFPDPLAKISQEDFKMKSKKAFKDVYELVKPSEKFRNVVCHGDQWASNIMIKYKNGLPIDCYIIDYQILRYCPPAHDLLCFIYLTTNRETRAQFATKLINEYYETLAKILQKYGCDINEICPYDEFMESCEHLTPQAVCQTVIFYHFTMTNSDLMKEYIESEEKTREIFLINRKDFLEDMCRRDPVYKKRLEESIIDLREMCMKYY